MNNIFNLWKLNKLVDYKWINYSTMQNILEHCSSRLDKPLEKKKTMQLKITL